MKRMFFSLLNTLFSSEHFPDAPMTGRKANQLSALEKGEKCPLAEAEGRTTLEAVPSVSSGHLPSGGRRNMDKGHPFLLPPARGIRQGIPLLHA